MTGPQRRHRASTWDHPPGPRRPKPPKPSSSTSGEGAYVIAVPARVLVTVPHAPSPHAAKVAALGALETWDRAGLAFGPWTVLLGRQDGGTLPGTPDNLGVFDFTPSPPPPTKDT